MNYKEHEGGWIEIWCKHDEIPTLLNLLKIRHSQREEAKNAELKENPLPYTTTPY